MVFGLTTALFISLFGWVYTIHILLRSWREMEKMVYPEEPEEEYDPPTEKEEVIDSMIEELESM